MLAMKAARILMGLSLQAVGDKVGGAKRAHLSSIEHAGNLASKSLRKRLCGFYNVRRYETLCREVPTEQIARALLANLESPPKKEITNAK
jgi:hypothetical protein